MANSITYKAAGVDIDVADAAKKRFVPHVKRTFTKDVLLGVGGFGGAISAKKLKSYKDPVLVGSVDGVGTKMKVAAMMQRFDTVGQDLVNHCANDILCVGAEPLFFLDYIATDKIKPDIAEQLIMGISIACRNHNMPLIGGETAQMPGVYAEGEWDLAGTIVGFCEKSQVFDKRKIKQGDLLVSIPSNGLMTNGFSLARKVLFETAGYKVDTFLDELGCTVGEALLAIHPSFSKKILRLRKKVNIKAIAHITGGGLPGNLPRVIPKGLSAEIEKSKIDILPIFKLIQRLGNVPEADMWRTFNMGVGLVLIMQPNEAEKACRLLGREAKVIGKVVKGKGVKIQ